MADVDQLSDNILDAISTLAKKSAEARAGSGSALQLAQAAQALAAAHKELNL